MKMSVSRGRGRGRRGAKGGRESGGGVGVVGQVVVESPADDHGHWNAFGVGQLVDLPALLVGEVDLRPCC